MKVRSDDPFVQFAIEAVALIDAISIDKSDRLAMGIEDEGNDVPIKKSLLKKLAFQASNIRRFFPPDDLKRYETQKSRLMATHNIIGIAPQNSAMTFCGTRGAKNIVLKNRNP